jgi:hypothetical protein
MALEGLLLQNKWLQQAIFLGNGTQKPLKDQARSPETREQETKVISNLNYSYNSACSNFFECKLKLGQSIEATMQDLG